MALIYLTLLVLTGFTIFTVRSLIVRVKTEDVLSSSILFIVSIYLWQIALITVSNFWDIEFIHRLAFVFALWGVLGGVWLSLSFPRQKLSSIQRTLINSLIVFNVIFTLLFLFTDLLISSYDIELKKVYFTNSGNIVLFYIFSGLLGMIISFVTRYVREREARFYFKYFAFFFVLTGLIAGLTNFLLPLFGNNSLSMVGLFSVLLPEFAILYTLGLGYINKLEFLIATALKTFFLIFALTLIVKFLFRYSTQWFPSQFSVEELIFWFIILLFTYWVLTFVDNLLDKYITRKGWEGRYSVSEITDKFSMGISDKVALKETLDAVTKFFIEIFEIEYAHMIIWNNNKIILFNSSDIPLQFTSLEVFYNSLSRLKSKDGCWDVNMLPSSVFKGHAKPFKTSYEFIALIPDGLGFKGFILLSKKKNFDPFTVQDVKAINSIVQIFKTSLSRSILHEKVEAFNDELRGQIDIATKSLALKIKALQETRKKERDMIDILGHEVRTPISIIKIQFELMKNYIDKNQPVSLKDINRYLMTTQEAIQRTGRIINMLLSATKFDAKSMTLNLEMINVIPLLKNSVTAFSKEASIKKLNLKLVGSKSKEPLDLYVDKVRIQEVFDNLIGNAVKYTEHGSVTVTYGADRETAWIKIKDTGVGIPTASLSKLGKKFYRVGQYIGEEGRMVRPGGTGLGLYVTFGIIKKHGGRVDVKSQYMKGSEFTVRLPRHSHIVPRVRQAKESFNLFEKLGLKKS